MKHNTTIISHDESEIFIFSSTSEKFYYIILTYNRDGKALCIEKKSRMNEMMMFDREFFKLFFFDMQRMSLRRKFSVCYELSHN